MVYNLYAIYDEKAKVFSPPRKGLNVEVFKRELQDELSEAKEAFKQHAADYKIYEVASYEDSTGLVSAVSPPDLICGLEELV